VNGNDGMGIADMFFCSHAVSRLLLGVGLLSLAITATSIFAAVLLAILALVLIRALDGDWRTGLRLLRLLRWFVIPILLLHMLFTPGQLLLPGWPIGVSREGVVQGAWLSVHLTSIYAMAILMFRLLAHAEWLCLLMRLPRFGEQMMLQALMMMSMKQHMGALLSYLQQQFRLRYDWKKLPLVLMAAFGRALADASTHAQMLWLRWPQQACLPVTAENCLSILQRRLFSTLWAVCGSASLVLPWLT